MSQLPRPRREADRPSATPVTLTPDSTLADLERTMPRASAAAGPGVAVASWPDLLRLIADILQDGIPMLEKGGKANVFQLLMLFARVQAAWAAFKALRNPPPA